MAQLLFVPVNLDALALAGGATVVGPYAAFDRLPYVLENDRITHQRADVNAERANIVSDIDADAFSDANVFLPPGIHLHWTLPQGLTKGLHTKLPDESQKIEFPPVPNRWLVVRRTGTDGVHWTVSSRWVVESDALFQIDSDPQPATGFPALTPHPKGLAAPFKVPVLAETSRQDAPQPRPEPYRYLGKATEFPIATTLNWRAQAAGRYLPSLGLKLTAIGYGEPLYAAFYPNCATVFGLYDSTPPPAAGQVRYDVFGWHADAADEALDPSSPLLGAFLGLSDDALIRLLNRFAASDSALIRADSTLTDANRRDAFRFWLEDNYGWRIDADAVTVTRVSPTLLSVRVSGEPLAGIVCYSSIILNQAHTIEPPKPFTDAIAVGNTGSEALAAWLAFQVTKGTAADPAPIEEQLEAANLGPELSQSQIDLGPRFREARHAKGFRSVTGESLWTIRPADAAADNDKPEQATIPDPLAHQLNALNAAQFAFDQATFDVNSWRQRLFSIWNLHMKASYPDNPDFLGTFGNDRLIGATARHARRHELKGLQEAKDRRAIRAAELVANQQNAQAALDAFNRSRPNDSQGRRPKDFVLQKTAGPRYWMPNDPVLFFGGDDRFKAPARYAPGTVAGRVRALANFDRTRVTEAAAAEYLAVLDALPAADGAPGLTKQAGSEPAWNPFLLEWEALVETADLSDYSPDFVKNNRALVESLLTFTAPPANQELPDPIFRPVRGRTLLKVQTVELARDAKLPDDLEQKLTAKGLTNVQGLAQSLGGFNRALLMHKQAYQLPLADPITFTDRDTLTGGDRTLFRDDQFRNFTQDVMDALAGTEDLDSPEPGYGFHPIHQGRIRLIRLRIVDTFGQTVPCYDLAQRPNQTIVCSLGLRCENEHRIGLPVRISQPARLSFRWLSAEADEVESTDHPATSPICGWVMPDHIDESLAVFDTDGKALGDLDDRTVSDAGVGALGDAGRMARWHNPPGPDDGSATIANIPNEHLRQLIQKLASSGSVSSFLTKLEQAIDQIDPENYAQHRARALLVGRPLALVRARVQLELRDLPATNQSWAALNGRLTGDANGENASPDSDRQFPNVKFPIRIGDHEQFNDGVAAYWVETNAGLSEERFPLDQVDDLSQPNVNTNGILWQSVTDGPVTVSLLVDPRAAVHASCGILPTKSIDIPADQFAAALKRMEVSFLTAPVLTTPGKTELPLPNDPELTFFWLQREPANWSVIPGHLVIRQQAILAAFPADGDRIWNQLALNNWIAPDVTGLEARVLPQPDSGLLPLDGFDSIRADVKKAIDLAARGIVPVTLDATFGPRVEIREGWLQLTSQF